MADKNVILKNIIGDVLHPEIADNSITTDKIIDGAITKEKLDPEVLSSKADNGIMIDIVNTGTEVAGIPVWKAVDDIPNRVIEQAFRKGVPVNFVIRDGYNYDLGSGESKYHLIPVYYMYFLQNNGSIELKAKSKDFIIYAHPIASGDYSKLGYITQNRWYVGKDFVYTSDIGDNVVTGDKLANNAVTGDKLADNAVTKDKLATDAFVTLITWSELKTLRDSRNLLPGHQYRIIDYLCTTTQEDTLSAGHQFDIIVTADSTNTLNEKARAYLHAGDTYFENSNLAAWLLWYCLDNDTNRFAWADDTGRGVIYRMIDEWNNDCPYDFKNIQFKRYKITSSTSSSLIGTYLATETLSSVDLEVDDNDYKMFYTFSYLGYLYEQSAYKGEILEDASILGNTLELHSEENMHGVRNNNIKYYIDTNSEDSEPVLILNNIVFLTYRNVAYYGCYSNSFGGNCSKNSFGNSCSNNSLLGFCFKNSFGDFCENNSFGYDCNSNIFGIDCTCNSLGIKCYSNSLNDSCTDNSFGNRCSYNSFGNECCNNSFSDENSYNTFSNSCSNNSFGVSCSYNSFNNNCTGNSFGIYCYNNKLNIYYNQNTFDNGASGVIFNGDGTGSKPIQNYHIKQSMVFDDGSEYTITAKPGLNYELSVAKKSDGTVVEYNEADTHKLVSITDLDYAALTTKDSNTVYCILEL